MEQSQPGDARARTEPGGKGPQSYGPVTVAIVVLLALVCAPFILSPFHVDLTTRVLIFAVLAMSLQVIYGYAGMISLGHAAFFGAGGYTAGLLMVRWNVMDFWTGLFVSIVVSALLAAFVGFIALRTRGIYFILVTFAMGQMVFSLADQWDFFHTSGAEAVVGISPPQIPPFDIEWTPEGIYYFVFIVCLVCVAMLHALTRSTFGTVLSGIRENESRMAAMGYNCWLYKFGAFIASGVIAGIAGVVFAYYSGILAPSNVDVSQSGLLVLMVILGGVGRLYGAAFGAAVIIVVDFFARQYLPERQDMILGLLFVITLIILVAGPKLKSRLQQSQRKAKVAA